MSISRGSSPGTSMDSENRSAQFHLPSALLILLFSAAFLRQSILLSAYETPETRALFNHSLQNVAGKVRTERRWQAVAVPEGVDQVGVPP